VRPGGAEPGGSAQTPVSYATPERA